MKGVGGGMSKKVYGPPPRGRKDRDEDLLLFKEIHRRDKDRLVSLLQPVSEDFEPNGTYPLQRVESGKKGSSGYEFFAEMSSKNDYDWLKTPPATPLFPSLEMEANAPDLVVQREIPVIQPLSRFADSAISKETNGRSKSPPNPKPRAPPPRSTTPSQRPTIQTTQTKPMPNQKITQLGTYRLNIKGSTTTSTPATMKPLNLQHKENQKNFSGSNLSKSTGPLEAKSKPKSRGVSPSVRTIIPSQIRGFSNQAPPNLQTDRSSSTSRGRPGIGNQTAVVNNIRQRTESTPKTRRQSFSPSVARGRKVDADQDTAATTATNAGYTESNGIIGQKGKFQTGNNGGQVLGSRMVDKFMNARKATVEDKETKAKFRGSINKMSGFGRLTSKSSSSSDMALKHMDIKREPANFQQGGIAARRR
ncbi:hypothetical protein NMG60_11028792 [Bertholletia excelsa]